MLDEQALYTRLANPMWMKDPHRWIWQHAGQPGATQGFGHLWRSAPGQSNLVWLAMGLESPPESYDLCKLDLINLLMMEGSISRVCGAPLFDVAGIYSLSQFGALLAIAPECATRVEKAFPVLSLLVNRRLHANP